jgi:hypothetical protein
VTAVFEVARQVTMEERLLRGYAAPIGTGEESTDHRDDRQAA